MGVKPAPSLPDSSATAKSLCFDSPPSPPAEILMAFNLDPIWVQAVSAVFTFFAVALGVWVNIKLANENRKIRQSQTEPIVIAYVELDWHLMVKLNIHNVGQGAAKDVEVKLEADMEDFNSHRVLLDSKFAAKSPFNYLAPGQKISMNFGFGPNLAGRENRDPLKPFNVVLQYGNILGDEKESLNCTIDIASYLGFSPGIDAVPNRVAKSLEDISKALKSIVQG